LSAAGVTTVTAFAEVSAQSLARRLNVELPIVRHWQEIARLATNPPGGTRLDVGLLHLLIECGVDSRVVLNDRLSQPRQLHSDLVAKAEDLTLVPPWKDTIEAWTGISWTPE
jgi:hypothetical protein